MKKSDLYGIIGSAISCGIILLLLFLIKFARVEKPEEEGIIVSFGDSYIGGGQSSTSNFDTPQPEVQEQSPTETQTQPSEEDVITQTAENALAMMQQQEENRRRQEEAERRRREEEQRRLAEERRLEEQRRQEAADRANALGQAFGQGDNTAGSGMGVGDEQQGNPAGRGVSDGNSWSLAGRNIVGSLVRPTHDRNIEGVITINIRVDESGNVVGATFGTPTDISDTATRNAALDAARRTKFSTGRTAATGTITYNFRLR